MPRIRIDEQTIEAKPGETILEVARGEGIDIPTLCHLDGHDSGGSCMVCAVKLKHNGQFVPACASRVVDGMEVEHASAEVRETRKMALELLFSDHLGDCLSPCERICPAQLGITTVLKHVRAGELGMAGAVARHDLPLAGVLCRVCNRPCEQGCRRGAHDEPVAIADLVIHAVEAGMAEGAAVRVPWITGERDEAVAIVGSGFSGLSAAWVLRQGGFQCTVIERDATPAESIRREFPGLPGELLDAEIRLLEAAGVRFRTGCPLDRKEDLDALLDGFGAVLLATGAGAGDLARALGLECAGAVPVLDPSSMMTSRPGVFLAGRAVRPNIRPVAAVAEGKAAAACVRQYLEGSVVLRPLKPFSVFMGKVAGGEIDDFLRDANPAERFEPSASGALDLARAIGESERCVHCNCAKADDCKLRRLAVDYGADPHRFSAGERMRFSRDSGHPLVNFEPGKCIRCGNCVMVAGDWKEQLGITFVGRGFDVRLGVPFHGSLEEGLREAAEAAVAACPTGALTLKETATRC